MATARKILIRPGIYQPPQGELVADRARIRGWVERFKAMQAAGLRIPVSWGHQPDAVPGDDKAAKQYYLSHYNAGYLRDLDQDEKGNLYGSLDVPGCEVEPDGSLTHPIKLKDGREVRGSVGEVSIAIKDFKDGQGRKWDDSIIHVALTPLPVVDSQEGFKALGLESCQSGPIYLSLTHLLSSEGEEMAEENLEDTKPAEGEGGESKKDHFAEAMEVLRDHGISLPDDTTPENFFERVCIAGHVLEGAETGEGEGDLDEDETEEPAEEYTGEEPASEEPRPVMMSLSTARSTAERKLIQKQQDAHKGNLNARIDRLEKRGLKPARAAELRQKVEGYTLSLDGEGDVVPKQVDFALSLLEDSLPDKAFKKHMIGRARGEKRPDARPDGPEAIRRGEEAGDELAAIAGVRKK